MSICYSSCVERDARSLSATRIALNAPELRGAIFVDEIHSAIDTRRSTGAPGDEKVIRVDRLQPFRDRRRVVCEDSLIRVRTKEIAEELSACVVLQLFAAAHINARGASALERCIFGNMTRQKCFSFGHGHSENCEAIDDV